MRNRLPSLEFNAHLCALRATVQELVHPKSLLQHATSNLQIPQPPATTVTPITPNFPVIQPLNITPEVLMSWAKTAAMILSNPTTPESSAALSALGDQLVAHNWVEAAHVWYALTAVVLSAPLTSS